MAAYLAEFGEEPTPRETQVAIALLFGHSVDETATELGIAPATVACHRERLHAKYGSHGIGELAAILIYGTLEQARRAIMSDVSQEEAQLSEFQQIPVGSQRWHNLVAKFIGVLMRERIDAMKAKAEETEA